MARKFDINSGDYKCGRCGHWMRFHYHLEGRGAKQKVVAGGKCHYGYCKGLKSIKGEQCGGD